MAEKWWKYDTHGTDEMSEWTSQYLPILLPALGTKVLLSPLFSNNFNVSLLKVVKSDLVQSVQDVITNSFPR
jgi:hypothetical protein